VFQDGTKNYSTIYKQQLLVNAEGNKYCKWFQQKLIVIVEGNKYCKWFPICKQLRRIRMNKILKLFALYRHKEKFVNESKQCVKIF